MKQCQCGSRSLSHTFSLRLPDGALGGNSRAAARRQTDDRRPRRRKVLNLVSPHTLMLISLFNCSTDLFSARLMCASLNSAAHCWGGDTFQSNALEYLDYFVKSKYEVNVKYSFV